MDLGYKLRNYAYWILDSIKGNGVKQHLNEFNKYYGKDTNYVKEIQYQRLEKLINHAKESTIFYKDYEGFDLQKFKIINKDTLRNEYDKFMSNKYHKDELVIMKTSGSTGKPMKYYLTKDKKNRQRAEVMFFGGWANYYVGKKYGYVRVRVNQGKLGSIIQNQIWLNPTNLTNEWLNKEINRLKKNNIKVLIGYPSAISALAKYSINNGYTSDNYKIEGVITSSETLYEEDRIIIEKAFDCKVLSRYSTEEFGVISNLCKDGDAQHVNELSYIVEILKLDEDIPAEPGEVGRIVVTDLFSYAMPIIRFDTGDLGVLGKSCNCNSNTMVLEAIYGRNIETIYDINGEKVSPFIINNRMTNFINVEQYQFIQNSLNENILQLKVNNKFNEENDIISTFKKILGNESNIDIKYVDQIPKLKSGKRPYIISNYKK